jgi:hypothetical protein
MHAWRIRPDGGPTNRKPAGHGVSRTLIVCRSAMIGSAAISTMMPHSSLRGKPPCAKDSTREKRVKKP